MVEYPVVVHQYKKSVQHINTGVAKTRILGPLSDSCSLAELRLNFTCLNLSFYRENRKDVRNWYPCELDTVKLGKLSADSSINGNFSPYDDDQINLQYSKAWSFLLATRLTWDSFNANCSVGPVNGLRFFYHERARRQRVCALISAGGK